MTRIAAHHAAAMHKVMVRRATQHGMLQEASKQVAAHYGWPHVGAQCIRSQLGTRFANVPTDLLIGKAANGSRRPRRARSAGRTCEVRVRILAPLQHEAVPSAVERSCIKYTMLQCDGTARHAAVPRFSQVHQSRLNTAPPVATPIRCISASNVATRLLRRCAT